MLDQADLRGADFSGALLKGASLRDVDVSASIGLEFGQQAA